MEQLRRNINLRGESISEGITLLRRVFGRHHPPSTENYKQVFGNLISSLLVNTQ